MDWSNESYVRLYTRDTTSWRRLGWDGQCVLMALLRKVDRAGTLDLDGLEPWEAVMLHIGCPEDVAQKGVAALLRVETIEIRGACLVFPGFIEAQECIKSDKLRAREYRQHKAKTGVTKRDGIESRCVTGGSQDVSKESREADDRHAPSHDVTPRHSLLCSALPSSALPSGAEREDARALDPPNPFRETEPTDPANQQTSQRPRLAPLDPDPHDAARARVRQEFAARYHAAQGSMWTRAGDPEVDTLAQWYLSLAEPRDETLTRTLDTFFADPWVRSHHFPVNHLAKYADKYREPRGSPAKTKPPETIESLRERSKQLVISAGGKLTPEQEQELKHIAKRIDELQDSEERRGRYARA